VSDYPEAGAVEKVLFAAGLGAVAIGAAVGRSDDVDGDRALEDRHA